MRFKGSTCLKRIADRTQSVQDILENSVYKHIGSVVLEADSSVRVELRSSMKHRDRAGSSSDAEPTNEI